MLSGAFLLGTIGVALMGISFLPFDYAKNIIDGLAPDGNCQKFNGIFHGQIAGRLRGIAFVILIAGGVLYAVRTKACAYAAVLMQSTAAELKEVACKAMEGLRIEEKGHLASLFVILMTAILVRVWFLFQPMRYDEAFTFIQFASKPLYTGLSDYSYPNNHPLHTLLVHITYRIFGSQPWAIRLPALCAGFLTVLASYVATRLVFDKRSAVLASALAATSPLLILYSTNARGYILICFIFLSLYALGAALLRRSTPGRWLLFTLLSAAGFYTIPVMLYPFGIIVVWLCLSVIATGQIINRRLFLQYMLVSLLAVAVLTGIAYLPIIAVSGLESLVGHRFIKPMPWTAFSTNILPYLSSIWMYLNRDLPAWITISCAAGFIASCIIYRRLSDLPVPIVAAVPIWFMALLLVNRVLPYERTWLFLAPLYFCCAASGISYVFSHLEKKIVRQMRGMRLLTVAVPVMLALWLSHAAVQTQSVTCSTETGTLGDAQAISLFMRDYLKPGDAVYALCPSDAPLYYYFTLHNVPIEYLAPAPDVNYKRMVVIVNHQAHQTLESVLDKAKLKRKHLSIPKIIKSYDSATLYEMQSAEG